MARSLKLSVLGVFLIATFEVSSLVFDGLEPRVRGSGSEQVKRSKVEPYVEEMKLQIKSGVA